MLSLAEDENSTGGETASPSTFNSIQGDGESRKSILKRRATSFRSRNESEMSSNSTRNAHPPEIKLRAAGRLIGKLAVIRNEHKARQKLAWKDLKMQCENILKYTKPGKRSDEELELLRRLLRELKLFDDVNDSRTLREVCNTMRVISVEKDTPIYVQGQLGQFYRILLFGAVDEYRQNGRVKMDLLHKIFANRKGGGPIHNKDHYSLFGPRVLTVPVDKGFGDLVAGTPTHPTTAVSSVLTTFLEIDLNMYHKLIGDSQESTMRNIWKRCDFLSKLSLFKDMKGNTVSEIAYRLQIKNVNRGEALVTKGEKINAIYIIRAGEGVIKNEVNISSVDQYYEEQQHQVDCTISKCVVGTMVGAHELLNDRSEYSHTIFASSHLHLFEMEPSDIFRLKKENPKACDNYREQEEQRLKWRENSQLPLNINDYMQRFTHSSSGLRSQKPTPKSKDFSHYIQKNLRQLTISDSNQTGNEMHTPEPDQGIPDLSLSVTSNQVLTARTQLLSSQSIKGMSPIRAPPLKSSRGSRKSNRPSPNRVPVPIGGSPTSAQRRRPPSRQGSLRRQDTSDSVQSAPHHTIPSSADQQRHRQSSSLHGRSMKNIWHPSPNTADKATIIKGLEGQELPSPRAFAFGLQDADDDYEQEVSLSLSGQKILGSISSPLNRLHQSFGMSLRSEQSELWTVRAEGNF